MSSYLMRAPPMMICGIKTSGTMFAAVFGSATNEEMSRPSATPPTAVRNMIARSIQNIPRTLQHRPVPDDVIGAVGEAEEHRDDQTEEEKGWYVICRSKIVCPVFRIAQNRRNQ